MENPYKVTIDTKADATSITTWREWRKVWQETNNLESCLGLLHILHREFKYGYDLGKWQTRQEILLTLFSLAEGHAESNLPWKTRAIRLKAFEVLDSHLFSLEGRRDLGEFLTEEKIIEPIFHFLRVDSSPGSEGLANLRYALHASAGAHARLETAKDFAREFCENMWRDPFKRWSKYRPRVLEILEVLGQLKGVLPAPLSYYPDVGPGWMKFDQPCIAKLEELIKLRGFDSPEEGVRRGNRTAQILLLIRAGQAEQARVDEADRLKRQVEDGKRALEKLGVKS